MNLYGKAMRFAALESAGFALQLYMSRCLNFEIRKFQIFRISEKNSKAKSILKNLLLESCRAKPDDSNAENHISLSSKLTEICNFLKIWRKKNVYASNQKMVTNKYVLELRILFVYKISESYMQ